MHVSMQVVANTWQRLKSTGLVLVVIGLLTLFALFGLLGTVLNHTGPGAVQPAVPHGGLMAPGGSDPPTGGNSKVA